MGAPAAKLARQLDLLEERHGKPARPVPRSALEWILWENAAYLVPDEKRARSFAALKRATGLDPERIEALPPHELAEWASGGGMNPEGRVRKVLAIAELVRERFGRDLERALDAPLPKARAALQRFPGIGKPGAEKILLFTGRHPLVALESNGLRTLVRLGYARQSASYAAAYRGAQAALAPLAKKGAAFLQRAHDLLRRHGQELCKNSAPLCGECPLAGQCPSASE
jgi:endonuclease III